MSQVKAGDVVHMHYTGKFEDGTVFDSTEDGTPLEFVAGSPDLIEGVSQAVIGMSAGEKKTVTIAPEQGYGPHQPELAQEVPLASLPDDVNVGDQLSASAEGREFRVWVTEMGPESATVDANHPLAGKTLIFDLQVDCIHPQA